ncbi:MAG: PAS domain S-box protein [Magnetococcales bacterium]|nr:PAS domain S-box protein [Magnetococcales bacterium]
MERDRRRVIIGLVVFVGVAIAIGLLALDRLTTLSGLTEQIYRHPFVVSNAVMRVREEVVVMRAALIKMLNDDALVVENRQHELRIREAMQRLREGFTGDPAMLRTMNDALRDWAASQYKSDEAYQRIFASSDLILTFTKTQADELRRQAEIGKRDWMAVMGIALVLTGLLLGLWRIQGRLRFRSATPVVQTRTVDAGEKFRLLLEAVQDAIIVTEVATGLILVANRKAEKLLKRPLSGLIGLNESQLFPVEEWGFYQEVRRIHLKDGKMITLPVVNSQGGRIPVEITLGETFLGEQRVFVGIFRDVTERHQAEQVLREVHSLELERGKREMQQFVDGVSHELQKALRPVSQGVHRLAKEQAGEMVDNVRQMQDFIEALLRYARVNAHGPVMQLISSQRVLDQVLENMAKTLDKSGGVVTHDPLPEVLGDPLQLKQMFYQLILNAIQFHGDRPPRIHVTAQSDAQVWRFCVQDNGVGIKPDDVERVFYIFQRLHPGVSGVGIGLALCKRIVARHGGEIWVKSVVGEGSAFYFTIRK